MRKFSRFIVLAALFTTSALVSRARAADPGPAAQQAPHVLTQSAPAESSSDIPAREPVPTMAATPGGALEGIWMFDAEHSDDPVKVMQANRPQGGGEGGGRGFGGGGFGGGGFGGGGFGGGRHGGGGRGMGEGGGDDSAGGDHPDQPAENRPRGRSPMARVMRPAKKVVIEMQTDQVIVTEDENAPRPYAIADSLKAHGHELLTENTNAHWKSGRLEMTQAMGERGKMVETYELSRDGRTLTIRASHDGGPSGAPKVTLTRVYTRYNGE